MDYLIILVTLAALSIAATLALAFACNKLDKTLLEMELQNLRDEFNFKINNN